MCPGSHGIPQRAIACISKNDAMATSVFNGTLCLLGPLLLRCRHGAATGFRMLHPKAVTALVL